MSIETRKLLNGCTVKACPKVTSPLVETRSARMPPGFMNATTGVLPSVTAVGSASWASAIRLPSGDSSESSGVRTTDGVVRCPITLFAIGATSVWYLVISAVVSGSFGTFWVTIWLLARVFARSTSPVALSMLSWTSVTSRPNEDALVTSPGCRPCRTACSCSPGGCGRR